MGDLDTIQQFFLVFMHCKSLSLLLGGGVWIQSNELVPCNSRVDEEGSGWVIWTQFNFHAF